MPKVSLSQGIGTITFRFTDIETPEGDLRIEMWRQVNEWDPDLSADGTYEVVLDHAIITSYPELTKELEAFFGEALINEFTLSVYDTPYIGQVLSVSGPGIKKERFDLRDEISYKLFTGYIRPDYETELYCSIKFKEHGSEIFEIMSVGELQESMSSTDLRVEHWNPSPFLNNEDNDEYNTERIWSLKFAHVAHSALTKTPIKPTQDPADTSTYYMPFWNPNAVAPAISEEPWDREHGALKVKQFVDDARYTDDSAVLRWPLFQRHISARLWLEHVFNYAFGEGNWTFECDDSPLKFRIGQLGQFGGTASESTVYFSNVEPAYGRPNFASKGLEHFFCIPQALFGLHDQLDMSLAVDLEPYPKLESSYTERFESVWEGILDQCYSQGWLPLVSIDESTGVTKAHISFKRREAATRSYTTIVPDSSEVEAYPESESGLAVMKLKSFLDAMDKLGWNDDFFATHNITLGPPDWLVDECVFKPQPNPYVVPEKSVKPAKLETSMSLGAIYSVKGDHADGNQYGGLDWYSVYYPNAAATSKQHAVNFPCTTPIMVYNPPAGLAKADPDAGAETIAKLFGPVMVIGFNAFGTQQADDTVCYSWRQALARLYAKYFVHNESKYSRVYPTIRHFVNSTEGHSTEGVTSWKNIDVLYQTKLPRVGRRTFNATGEYTNTTDYYCKKVVRTFNTMKTTAESILSDTTNNFFLDGWRDDSEQTGDKIGPPPNIPPTEKRIA